MHAHHLPKHKYEIQVFRACAFRAKNPECYGFFWQCKRYNNKKQVFWILVFANVNGPIDIYRISLCFSFYLIGKQPCEIEAGKMHD